MDEPITLSFTAPIFEWRGPAPFYFVQVPEPHATQIKAISAEVTYGWGMIPALVRMGSTEWETALWPRHGAYVVPLKAWVRAAERVDEGDRVTLRLTI